MRVRAPFAFVAFAVALLLSGCFSPERYVLGSTAFAGEREAPPVGGELRLASALRVGGAAAPVIGFPLRHTDVRTRIVGTLAISTVVQVFDNPLTEPVDAVYVFPLGDRAAVSAYRIEIGARTIEGVIARRAEARATYERARTAGRTAALLEQVTAGVFSQRLANLAPGERITVRFELSEPLALEDGELVLAFPLTVGPRYLPATARGRAPVSARQAADAPVAGETSIGYVDSAIAGNTVSFTADVDLPLAAAAVTSPSHDLLVTSPAPGRTRITLAARDEVPNRDLVVRLRTGDERARVTTTAHRGGDGGYALVTITPPLAVQRDEETAREVILLVDRSGSMADGGLVQAQGVAKAIVRATRPGDTLNVLAFADDVSRMADAPVAADDAGRARALAFVDELVAGGGTPLTTGVLAALDVPLAPGRVRTVYVISDGLVGNDDVVVDAARGSLGANRIYPVGIGAAPNRALLDELARVGRGFATYVGLTEPAPLVGAAIAARSQALYLTDVAIDWAGLAVSEQAPALVPDVHAGLPLTIAVRYAAPARGTIVVRGLVGGRPASFTADVELPAIADDPAVRLAWARARVDDLAAGEEGARELPAVSRAIEELGLRYAIVTRETSFVAVDRTRVVEPGGAARVVEAPATVPEGVDLEQVAPSPHDAPVQRGSRVGTAYELGYVNPPSSGRSHGDVDPITLALAAALVAMAWTRRGARGRTLDELARAAPWTVALALAAPLATALALADSSRPLLAPIVADGRVTAGPWRLVLGPLVHGSWGHLARDLALVALVGLAYEPVLARRHRLYLAGLAVPALAALAGGASVYLGLSGLSHALVAAALVHEVRRRAGAARAAVMAIAALTLAKVGYELVSGAPAFPLALPAGAYQDPIAHAAGLVTGAAIAWWPRAIAPAAGLARASVVASSRP